MASVNNKMSFLVDLLKRLSGRTPCIPTTGCVPRPQMRSDGEFEDDSDDYSYGDSNATNASAALRPLTLTVPGANCPVLVDSVMERKISDMAALVTHVGEWTEISLFESKFCRAPVRVCRSVFAQCIFDANGFFKLGDCQALQLKHGQWYMRRKVAPSVACFVVVVCLKNDGMAAVAVDNTQYLNVSMCEGDAIIFPAARGVFMLPQVGGNVEYLIANMVPTQDLLDMGYEVFNPSVNQDAQIRTANAADARRKACAIVDSLVTARCDLESCYQEICRMMIMMAEFGERYSEVGAQMITTSVNAIAKGMGAQPGAAACRQALRPRRPVSAALTRSHALLNSGLQSLFAVFAQAPDGRLHPDSLMARMEQDMRGLYDRFSARWDAILELASDLDSTLPRCDAVEKFIHLRVCSSDAGVKRSELVQRLTMLAGSGYRITGSGEGVQV
ncbi:hypothetical protein SePPVgORF003 [Seal parapoxvirus]|uniref:Uncharacterized protein n=1 Tax=Seal parapoxvirus TaxID=187984 RepID=A0A1Z3GCY1_9POXV|nr:hypothetical protein CGV03_gp003 [Seal parapoxvirus]ASC55622.1 hypothetical protein SePPVgORF003 [Seal parapoxvirus]